MADFTISLSQTEIVQTITVEEHPDGIEFGNVVRTENPGQYPPGVEIFLEPGSGFVNAQLHVNIPDRTGSHFNITYSDPIGTPYPEENVDLRGYDHSGPEIEEPSCPSSLDTWGRGGIVDTGEQQRITWASISTGPTGYDGHDSDYSRWCGDRQYSFQYVAYEIDPDTHQIIPEPRFSNWVTVVVRTNIVTIPRPDIERPFTILDVFYQERVRRAVELVLQETDGVDIRTWALQSDFTHTELEWMTLPELVEILTHVAIVGR